MVININATANFEPSDVIDVSIPLENGVIGDIIYVIVRTNGDIINKLVPRELTEEEREFLQELCTGSATEIAVNDFFNE